MAIGKISGVMLKDNLERQGVNLAFDGNLAYLDVTNRRLGVGTSTPAYSLDAPGNVRAAYWYSSVVYNKDLWNTIILVRA